MLTECRRCLKKSYDAALSALKTPWFFGATLTRQHHERISLQGGFGMALDGYIVSALGMLYISRKKAPFTC